MSAKGLVRVQVRLRKTAKDRREGKSQELFKMILIDVRRQTTVALEKLVAVKDKVIEDLDPSWEGVIALTRETSS